MSEESDKFVLNLKASLGRMPEFTEVLYKQQLAKWKLGKKQWAAALERLIKDNIEGRLIPLPVIYRELDRQREIDKMPINYAWASFRWKDRDYSIRVKRENEAWRIADLVWTDAQGVQHLLQKNVGEPVAEHIPNHATEYVISPDHPADPEPHDIPDREWIAEKHREIQGNLAKMGRR